MDLKERHFKVRHNDAEWVSVRAEGWEILRSGALHFWNLNGRDVFTVALYPAGEWLYVMERNE